jgi:DNA recombination protein RmuC
MPTDQLIIVALGALVVVLAIAAAYLAGSRGRGRHTADPAQSLAPIALPTGAEALAPIFQTLQGQLGDVTSKLEQLRVVAAAEEARRPQVDQAYASLQQLTAKLLGSANAGATGERIVEDALSVLPPQWLITDHRVANKPVEFAVRLPDGLVLPIDSKVVAQSDLVALDGAQNGQREKLEGRIRTNVLQRAGEVRQYVDGRTPGFAIAAIPDAAYRLSAPVLPRAYQEYQVVIVPYSLLLPFVMLCYEQHRRHGVDLDAANQVKLLAEAETHIKRALQELNGRIGRAFVELTNGRDALGQELSDAGRALDLIRAGAAQPPQNQPAHREKVRA